MSTVLSDAIVRDALVTEAWLVVTRPDELIRWFCNAAEVDLRAGGTGRFTWTDRAANRPTVVRIPIEQVEPPHAFSFPWLYRDGAKVREGNSMLVAFALTAQGQRTRLHVSECGLLAVDGPAEQNVTYAEGGLLREGLNVVRKQLDAVGAPARP